METMKIGLYARTKDELEAEHKEVRSIVVQIIELNKTIPKIWQHELSDNSFVVSVKYEGKTRHFWGMTIESARTRVTTYLETQGFKGEL
jgi:hypothetical protein